jgi:trimethylamine corrinoid protein
MFEIEQRWGVEFERALLRLDAVGVKRLVVALNATYTPMMLAEGLVQPIMERIGTAWAQGKLALSQVYMAGRICEEIVDAILPPGAHVRKAQPKMAIAVLEDHHALGKRLVYAMLRASGYELQDYGYGIRAEDLVHRALQDGIEVLLISTLMLPAALHVKEVCAGVRAAASAMKIVVGGAPFLLDEDLWREVGADAMGCTASEAVTIVQQMWGEA